MHPKRVNCRRATGSKSRDVANRWKCGQDTRWSTKFSEIHAIATELWKTSTTRNRRPNAMNFENSTPHGAHNFNNKSQSPVKMTAALYHLYRNTE